jgi:pre-mRNA-splicing factor 38A
LCLFANRCVPRYWITKLFYANATTILDLAVALEYYGGVSGAMGQPSDFLCLLLKLLVIKPEADVIQMFLETDFRYLRLLALVYVRLTAAPKDVYETLEPFYLDFRQLAHKQGDGSFAMRHLDECVDDLLTEKQFCNIALPPIVKRYKLEEAGLLQPRVSPLQAELEAMAAQQPSDDDDDDGDDKKKKKKQKKKNKKDKKKEKKKEKKKRDREDK